MKKIKTLAEQIADLDDPAPRELDPEDQVEASESDDDPSVSDGDAGTIEGTSGREHYVDVGKSQLRRVEEVPLGPQYSGSRISRDAVEDDSGDDPFALRGNVDDESGSSQGEEDEVDPINASSTGLTEGKETEDEVLDVEDNFNGISGSTSDEDDRRSDEGESDGDGDDDDDDESDDDDTPRPPGDIIDRTALRKMMSESQKSVLATISQATKADAAKGRAVKRQRQTYDALLNTRIRLQKALIATNTMTEVSSHPSDANDAAYAVAEEAALHLWHQVTNLRATLNPSTATKRIRPSSSLISSTPLSTLWTEMQGLHNAALPVRRSTLEKWASKARVAPTLSTAQRLNNTARQQNLTDVLDGHLSGSNVERLLVRTQMPRSCAPHQATAKAKGKEEREKIFDDADFYQLLLKELVEQRMADASLASASTGHPSRTPLATFNTNADTSDHPISTIANLATASHEAKTHRRNVDVKASKGRKLRYVVHEKLQNFMAPEDRSSWAQRQVDELFGGLFGRRGTLDEDDDMEDEVDGEREKHGGEREQEDDDDDVGGLRLFG
ncbi:MAG: rRNA-processing protein bfr2 [Thelocarpon superellum]|nr:MAG: rRNA-processing protein bfr2 [Thelocarpon superellum]